MSVVQQQTVVASPRPARSSTADENEELGEIFSGLWEVEDSSPGEDGKAITLPRGKRALQTARSANVFKKGPHALRIEFKVHSWSILFGITDSDAAFDPINKRGGRSWGLKLLGGFFSTENANFPEGHGASREPLLRRAESGEAEKAPLGLLSTGKLPMESGFLVSLHINWPTGHLCFALEGGEYREAPMKLPADVEALRVWAHAEGTGGAARLSIESVEQVNPGAPPEPHIVDVNEPLRMGRSVAAEAPAAAASASGYSAVAAAEAGPQWKRAKATKRPRSSDPFRSPISSPVRFSRPLVEDEEEARQIEDEEARQAAAEAMKKWTGEERKVLSEDEREELRKLWSHWMEPRPKQRQTQYFCEKDSRRHTRELRERAAYGGAEPAHILRAADPFACRRLFYTLRYMDEEGYTKMALDKLRRVDDWFFKAYKRGRQQIPLELVREPKVDLTESDVEEQEVDAETDKQGASSSTTAPLSGSSGSVPANEAECLDVDELVGELLDFPIKDE
jgi:hypothetical protein